MAVRSISELVDERRHRIKTLEDMAERATSEGDRNFTPDEQATMDLLDGEIKTFTQEIEDREAHEARMGKIKGHIESLSKPVNYGGQDPGSRISPKKERNDGYPRIFRRSGKLKAFVHPDGSPDDRGAYRSGMWLAASNGDEKAFRWCQNHDIEVRAMSEGVNTKGGVLVPDELSQRIIDNRESYGVMRQSAFIESMGSDVKNISRQTGGNTAYFVGEGVDLTESDAAYDNVKLVAKKLAVSTRISSELDEDAVINLADRFAMDAAKALALKEDQCGFNGDGTSTFGGIHGIANKFSANTGFAGVFQGGGSINSWAEVSNTHLGVLMAKLPAYVTSPKWYVHRAGWAAAFQRLAVAGGGNTIQNLEGGFGMSYLGIPIVISQVLTATATGDMTTNDCMILLGDMSLAVTLGDRRGIRLARSEEKYWTSDEIALKATERLDINVHDIGDASTAGPVVAMLSD
jgi:HK97 family phage major capsid protein